MAARGGPVHVVTTSRTYKGQVYTSHLLRRSYREGDKVRNETLGNLSHLPARVVELVRQALKGEAFVAAGSAFEILNSRPHGHVQAVSAAMRRLGFAALIASRPSRERDLVCAMVGARVLAPHTKLATTRWWHTTTLADAFAVSEADEDELYAAMDWLLARQAVIEKKLAARQLSAGGLVRYDLSSSYFEGSCCPLAKLDHNRDGKKGKLQVNTADCETLLAQVERVRNAFAIDTMVMVGDRGMISHKGIGELRKLERVAWITAMKSAQIRPLIEQGSLQLGLFDVRNLFEFTHPEFPGERLVACRNPELAKLRAHKRQALIEATVVELDKVRAMVARKRLSGRDQIGLRVGRVLNKYKVAKHFEVVIEERRLAFYVRQDAVAKEAALDGIYVLRTPLDVEQMDSAQIVRSYKSLSAVERAFRSLKTVELKVRPIHHRLADRVRAHIFLCMLAYYVEWHMCEAWRCLLFADEDLNAKAHRDPVAPAKRSAMAERKAHTHTLADGTPAHSFRTLIEELATIVRNTCRARDTTKAPTFPLITQASPTQRRALDLLETIRM
jgi:Transposase DDE domain